MTEADLRMRPGCMADVATYRRGWRLFWDPQGRSSRTELAMLSVLPLIPISLLSALFAILGINADPPKWLVLVMAATIVLPLPAAIVRRLHDTGRTGWLALPVFALMAVSFYDGWLDAIASYPDNDLWYNREGMKLLFYACWLGAVVMLIWPPKDENNPYGPNPRPAEKTI